MSNTRKALRALLATLLVTGGAGCAATSLQSALVAGSGTTVHAEGPVETYSRIARGALGCWFRNDGTLKKTHVFHADVASDSATAEIVIHERDIAAPSPRSIRALKVTITATGQGSQVVVENLKFPEPVGREMMEEIPRWADDKPSCISPGGPSLAVAVQPTAPPPAAGANQANTPNPGKASAIPARAP